MKTMFNAVGNTVNVFSINQEQLTESLAPRVYSVGFNKMQGFFLKVVCDTFILPDKVYGSTSSKISKVVNAYESSDKNVGVILTGDKGAGKSLFSQVLSNQFIDAKRPVVLVSEAFSGEEFESFIFSLGDCVVIFDEFTKTYEDQEGDDLQGKVLTLFDGASGKANSNKVLFVVIDNYARRLNQFIVDRPGRFLYHFKYNKLPEDVILGYCDDKGIDIDFVKEILEFSRSSTIFGFDYLRTICAEHFMYPDVLFSDIMEDLNIEYSPHKYEYYPLKLIEKSTEKEIPVLCNSYSDALRFMLHTVIDKKKVDKTALEDVQGVAVYPHDEVYRDGSVIVMGIGNDYLLYMEERQVVDKEYLKYLK